MTAPPKRALLSLKSMGVMCGALALLMRADTAARWEQVAVGRGARDWQKSVDRVGYRGFPWPYSTERRRHTLILGEAGETLESLEDPLVRPHEHTSVAYFLLDLAFALAVSVVLALASERFVFSRMRRRREGEKAPLP